MKAVLTFSTMVLLVAATAAQAQIPVPPPPDPVGGTLIAEGADYGRYGYHASTLQEGVARGIADGFRSAGEFNRANSEAAINLAEARRVQLENRERAVDAFYNVRQKIRDYRWAERRPRPSKEDLARYAEAARPDRLNPAELNGATGELSWPILLRGEAFAKYRAELEGLFKQRAANRSITIEEFLQIKQVANSMRSELKSRVRELPLNEYAVARRFLKSVAYEAQLPVGPLQGIANDTQR